MRGVANTIDNYDPEAQRAGDEAYAKAQSDEREAELEAATKALANRPVLAFTRPGYTARLVD